MDFNHFLSSYYPAPENRKPNSPSRLGSQ